MATLTRSALRDSPLSRATRALFAFLFRNALPADPAETALTSDDITRRRRYERALAGAALIHATTYRPSDGISLAAARAASRARNEDTAARSASA